LCALAGLFGIIIFIQVEDAFDTFRNQRVWAAAATISRFPGHFICPLCRAEVRLASGPSVRDHFRHLRGTDHEACERYSKNFGQEVPLSEHEFEYIDAVLVAKRAPLNGIDHVAFAVRFRPAKRTGRVKFTGQVNFLSGKHQTPHTIQPVLRQQYFRITSPEESYLVKAKLSDGGEAQYPIEGFSEKPAVFRASEREAVRIAKHRLLKSGEHIVVSKQTLLHSFHPTLSARALATLSGLHAVLIQIPENPNSEVKKNVKSLLHFEIAAKVAAYAFLKPSNAYELAPDCWEVSKDSELIIFIRVASDYRARYASLLVQHRQTGHLTTDYLDLDRNSDELVIQLEPGIWKSDILRIGLATGVASSVLFLFEIKFSDSAVEPQCVRIQFEFATNAEIRTKLKWSAYELPRRLINVADGIARLLSITGIPESVEITFSDARGQSIKIAKSGNVEELVSFLQQAQFPCALSASWHGCLVLERKRRVLDVLVKKPELLSIAPRCRREARLQDAYKRGHVSKYAIYPMSL
jgi:hypothetical protein